MPRAVDSRTALPSHSHTSHLLSQAVNQAAPSSGWSWIGVKSATNRASYTFLDGSNLPWTPRRYWGYSSNGYRYGYYCVMAYVYNHYYYNNGYWHTYPCSGESHYDREAHRPWLCGCWAVLVQAGGMPRERCVAAVA